MPATKRKQPVTCIYCGEKVTGVGKGEHVIPKALGCVPTLKNVCTSCNNSMSDIDKELTWESPVRMVAWDVLQSGVHDTLDYDASTDLALQARILPGYASPALWPQVVLEPNGKIFLRADAQEMRAVGPEQYLRRFHGHLMRARNTLRDGSRRPRWIWKRMVRPPKKGRFPPRVFTRHTYAEFSDRMHFECRYLDSLDRNRLLSFLDRWRPLDGKIVYGETVGVADPEDFLSYRPRFVLRALVKIGVNLLAYVCERTVVGKEAFPEATACARYDQGGPTVNQAGFVANESIHGLDCPPNAHRFALTYDQRSWFVLCAFFGGRIGAFVRFPGPNRELGRRVDIVAPLHSPDWEITTGKLFLPVRVCIEWADLSRIVPSLRIRNPQAQIRFERSPRRKPSS